MPKIDAFWPVALDFGKLVTENDQSDELE